jgi:ABC-2 type transport system permease protein
MRKIWAIAMNDVRQLFADRGAAVSRLLVPVALIFVIGIANGAFESGDFAPPLLELRSQDQGTLAQSYLEYITGNAEGFRVCGEAADPCPAPELDASRRLATGTTDFTVEVPAGFGESVRSDQPVTVTLRQDRSDPQAASAITPVLDAAGRFTVALASAGSAAASVTIAEEPETRAAIRDAAEERALVLLSQERVRYEREEIELPRQYPLEGFQQSVPGQGSMFVMLSVLAGASLIVADRKRGTLQRVRVAPISRAGFVAGKILGRFLIGMAQYIVAIGTGAVIGVLFDIRFGSSPFLLLLVMAAFALAASGISVLVATLVRREQQAATLTMLIVLTLAPLGGAWWSLDMEVIPTVMHRIAVISPFYWVMEGFRAGIYDLGIAAAALPLLVLTGVAVVTAGIAALRDPL